MRKLFLSFFTTVLTCLLSSCSFIVPEPSPQNTITQISTSSAFFSGVYDGFVSVDELKMFGNIGIGIFDACDGEMVLFNGNIYQIKSDGKVYRPDGNQHIPFANVVDFKPQKQIQLTQRCNYRMLKEKIDSLADKNLITVILIKGKFRQMKTRSVPAQKKPYPHFKDIVKHQSEFNMKDIEGYIIGIRLPAYGGGIFAPGYHLHFLSSDYTKGGHVLEFEMTHGIVALQNCDRFYMILPSDNSNFNKADLCKD